VDKINQPFSALKMPKDTWLIFYNFFALRALKQQEIFHIVDYLLTVASKKFHIR